jgi:hypothetical protein
MKAVRRRMAIARPVRSLTALAVTAVAIPAVLGVVTATSARAAVPVARVVPSAADPVVTGPVTGGNGAIVLPGTTQFDLRGVGYTPSEFFLSGTAASYLPAAPLGPDGKWRVKPATAAPYTTRMVVYRPAGPRRFNGTVVVEWLNVSGGVDAAPEWLYTHNELIRDGFAWVGVSGMTRARSSAVCILGRFWPKASRSPRSALPPTSTPSSLW